MNLHIRVTEEQKRNYSDEAYKRRICLSDWIRDILDREVKKKPIANPTVRQQFRSYSEDSVIDVGDL